jgi:hypothetical protein
MTNVKTVNATAIDTCDFTLASLTYNWQQRLSEVDPNIDIFDSTKSTVVVDGYIGNSELDIYQQDAPIKLDIKNNEYYISDLDTTNGKFIHIPYSADSTPPTAYPSVSNTTGTLNFGYTTPTNGAGCISEAKNVVYTQAFTSIQPPVQSTNETDPQNRSCSPTDFQCWIGNAFFNMQNTLKGLGEAIAKSIAFLFAPSANTMQNAFDTLASFFDEKLGFLAFPFTFIVDMFTALLNTNTCASSGQSCNNSGYGTSFGNWFGGNLSLDVNSLQNLMPSYYDLLINIFRAVTVATLIFAFHRKYMEVVKSA